MKRFMFSRLNCTGMVRVANINGVQTASGASGGVTSFTLWTPDTSINLYSPGGNLSPGTTASDGFGQNNGIGLYPGTLIAAAASGNLYVSAANSSGVPVPIELMPSPVGQLELLAAGSMYGGGASIAMSGAAMNSLATPLNPVFTFGFGSGQITNASPNSAFQSATSDTLSPIAFGPDTPTTNLHGDDSNPALIYAGGDIVNVQIGFIDNLTPNPGGNFVPAPTTWYIGAKPFRITASIGVATFESDDATAGEILVNADLAMYAAKTSGRDRVVVYTPTEARKARAMAKLTWSQRIQDALEHDRFVLHLQPILELSSGQIKHGELLLRMKGDSPVRSA